MNKKNILIGAFLLIILVTAYFQYKQSIPTKQKVEIQTIEVQQIIVIDGKKNQSPIRGKKGITALQLLSINHKVLAKGEKENAFITTIDMREALTANREFWAFYVNGKQATVGAGSYFVKNNDTIEWKIETY